MTSRLPPPHVPSLVNGSIDLEKLGTDDLLTYVAYPGIAAGDAFVPLFKGCGANGELFDALESLQIVDDPVPEEGIAILFPNDLLHQLDGGTVFYSYAMDDNGTPGEESRRQFIYVNKAPDAALGLPPVQLLDSHELVIDYDALGSADLTVVAAPYQAMAINDVVTFTWQLYLGEDNPDPPLELSKTLVQKDLGRPLAWSVNNSYLYCGFADMHYRIDYAGGASSTTSPLQRVRIEAGLPPQSPLLPAPAVKGLVGDKLDPESYPRGLLLVIEPPPGLQLGDELLLHAQGQGQSSTCIALRVEQTILDSQRLELRLEQAWLRENVGEQVSLVYQWSRLGQAARSEPLQLLLRRPLNLPAPVVQQATAEGEEGAYQGFIAPNLVERGAIVNVPAGAVIDGGIVEMHWDGHGSTGKYSTTTPTTGNPRRFQIPASAMPANLGRRLNVYYTVTLPGEVAEASTVFDLHITDYLNNPFPPIQCVEASAGRLSLANVGSEGATFELGTWPFFAEGQRVRIQVSGTERDLSYTLRDDLPVSEDEYYDGELVSRLPKRFLESMKLNFQFRVNVAVSFDDGATYKNFPQTTITLEA